MWKGCAILTETISQTSLVPSFVSTSILVRVVRASVDAGDGWHVRMIGHPCSVSADATAPNFPEGLREEPGSTASRQPWSSIHSPAGAAACSRSTDARPENARPISATCGLNARLDLTVRAGLDHAIGGAHMSYYCSKSLNVPLSEAVERTVDALKSRGLVY